MAQVTAEAQMSLADPTVVSSLFMSPVAARTTTVYDLDSNVTLSTAPRHWTRNGDGTWSASPTGPFQSTATYTGRGLTATRTEVRVTEAEDGVDGLRKLGAFGMKIPPEYGGLGLSATIYAKIVTRISSVWMSLTGIFNSHLMMAQIVQRFEESSAALRVRRALALGAWEPPDPGALDLHTPWEEAGSALPFDRSLRAADADGRATRRGTRVGTSASLGVALARVLCACGVPGTDREPTLAAPVAAGIRRMMADAEARGEVSDSMVLGLRPSSAR